MSSVATIESLSPDQTIAVTSDVQLLVSLETLEELERFISHAVREMKRMGDSYDHLHFQDFSRHWNESMPDIIIGLKK